MFRTKSWNSAKPTFSESENWLPTKELASSSKCVRHNADAQKLKYQTRVAQCIFGSLGRYETADYYRTENSYEGPKSGNLCNPMPEPS